MDSKPTEIRRIDTRYLGNELLLLANLEKGLGYTLRRWVLRPGQAAQEYLYENRQRMMKPLGLLALSVAIATFLSLRTLPLGDPLWQDVREDLPVGLLSEELVFIIKQLVLGMKQYFNLFFVLSLPGQAIGTFVCFQGSGYNIAEHLVINTYIFCIQTVMYLLTLPFLNAYPGISAVFLSTSLLLYTFYAAWRIFRYSALQTLLRISGAYLLAQVVSNFLITVLITLSWMYLSLSS